MSCRAALWRFKVPPCFERNPHPGTVQQYQTTSISCFADLCCLRTCFLLLLKVQPFWSHGYHVTSMSCRFALCRLSSPELPVLYLQSPIPHALIIWPLLSLSTPASSGFRLRLVGRRCPEEVVVDLEGLEEGRGSELGGGGTGGPLSWSSIVNVAILVADSSSPATDSSWSCPSSWPSGRTPATTSGGNWGGGSSRGTSDPNIIRAATSPC
mmetsp:Transcript_10620/g.21118  ORF Transcript_10620/g.21118 Transcript_10620/m.21118 type:complete len:211 (-) Transcript_10620:184-816(-)